jgi:hypothetical protein
MIPTHYLEILLGVFVGVPIGVPIGGFLVALITSRKLQRISAEEWLAARKFYTGK